MNIKLHNDDVLVLTDFEHSALFSFSRAEQLKKSYPTVKTIVVPNDVYKALFYDAPYRDESQFFNGEGVKYFGVNDETLIYENLFTIIPEAYVKK